VLNKLNKAGFQAYLVGGGVRDLLLRHAPKDFDVATNATPQQVKSIFRNARIIGRRFKLVHILCHREIIEVTTFRAQGEINEHQKTNEHGILVRDNVYGSLEEDAWRRDFTINALYYNQEDGAIIDYTGGVADVQNKTIRIIGNPVTRYQEDPVRMLRALRFSAKLKFTIEKETSEPIYKLNKLICHISGSRLFEEMVKLYQCGHGVAAQKLLVQYGLFDYLFPLAATHCKNPKNSGFKFLALALESTDQRLSKDKPVNPGFVYAVLLWFPLQDSIKQYMQNGLEPLSALEYAMHTVIREQNKTVMISKRYAQTIRDIWFMQYRFEKRSKTRVEELLQHPRFRAAYDFLALRALVHDAPLELAEWWTTLQEVDAITRETMLDALTKQNPKKRKVKR
jgi:poly(A) polymerase